MTIKARMQDLVGRTAEDIKACANACDAYAKKKLVVKVIKSAVWDDNLKGYLQRFAQRRRDFAFALAIHVGAGVDDAAREVARLGEKLDAVLEFFARHAFSAEHLELAALVQKKGGPAAVMADTDALKELAKFRSGPGAPGAGAGAGGKRADGNELEVVREELFDSPELAIKKNLEVFERKFKMQQLALQEEMERMVHRAGDRIIKVVTSGPHDRIKDPVSA